MSEYQPIKKKSRNDSRDLDDISDSKRKYGSDTGSTCHSEMRQEAHERASAELSELLPTLPKKFGSITVLDFGKINIGKSFHTPVKIYPVGYKCEVEVDPNLLSPRGRAAGNSALILQGEIMEMDDEPEFLLTVKSTSKVYIASSEADVWRKFEGDNHLQNALSFFNLEIEVLLEGLDRAVECGRYLFHCERGYGESYTTDEQAALVTNVFMSRQSRELRSRQRSQARSMTAEESKVIADAKKKQQKLDAEIKKRLLEEEKQQKERERKQREKEKELERKRKEVEKALRDREKELARRGKEQQKKEDRARNNLRKDAMGDLRKARAEAVLQVGQAYDQEEDEEELRRATMGLESITGLVVACSAGTAGESASAVENLEDLLLELPTFKSRFGIVGGADVDKVLDVVGILYSLKGLLKIGDDISFDFFVHDVLGVPRVENADADDDDNDSSGEEDDRGRDSDGEDSCSGNDDGNRSDDDSSISSNKRQSDFQPQEDVDDTTTHIHQDSGVAEEKHHESLDIHTEGDRNVVDMEAVEDMSKDADTRPGDDTRCDGPGAICKANGSSDLRTTGNEEAPLRRKPGRPRRTCVASTPDVPKFQQSAVDLDRIQLNMIRVMLDNLHSLFNLSEKDTEPGAKRKGKTATSTVTLPLNQLTWQELARMLIVLELNRDADISEDEMICTIRGSRQSNYRTSKNVIRYIRHRMAVRYFVKTTDEYSMKDMDTAGDFTGRSAEMKSGDIEDFLLRYALPESYVPEGGLVEGNDDVALFDFESENEVLQMISEVSENTVEYSEEYRRCCKVWLRVAAMSQAKSMMWDVDEHMYPDYFMIVKHPISFSRVAIKLVKRGYGNDGNSPSVTDPVPSPSEVLRADPTSQRGDDMENGGEMCADEADDGVVIGDDDQTSSHTISRVAASFYRDMRQVIFNCFAYNTEAFAAVAQAQKLLQVLHRHMGQWVYNPSRPSVDACNDRHCLFSFEEIPLALFHGEYNSVKCGRCNGIFAIESLVQNKKELGVVQPSQEQLQQQSEEWICMLCLQEDSVMTEGHDGRERGVFAIDEWGPSTLLPWQLNTRHSAVVDEQAKESPRVWYMVEALRVLSSPNITAILQEEQRHKTRSTSSEQVQIPWSMNDRLNVFAALCEVLKGHSECNTYLNGIYNECVKLSKMSIREPFHEADFLDQVRKIAGNDGAALCLRMMDGIDQESAHERLKYQVIDGRCLVCRGSTFDDDCDGTVLLCDGCNGEAHFTCLDIEKIPTKEWFCESCTERMSSRNEDDSSSLEAQFKDIDSYRSKEMELRLIDERRDSPDGRQEKNEPLCAYCGQTELDLCSPMVYGQSRAEFNAYVAMSETPTADDIFPNRKDTTLKFCVMLEEVKPPEPSMPYYPLVNDPQSSRLKLRKASSIQSPVVHEICALAMFKARMQRNKHTIRRRRRIVADRIASLSGMSIQPLGYDNLGRSYWQFPNSPSLFISPPCSLDDREPDREALLNMLKPTGSKPKKSKVDQGGSASDVKESDAGGALPNSDLTTAAVPTATSARNIADDWIIVEDLELIAQVIELLGRSAEEMTLRKTLSGYYTEDIERLRREKKEAAAAKAKAVLVAAESVNEAMVEGQENGTANAAEVGGNIVEGPCDGNEAEQEGDNGDDDNEDDRDFSGMEGRVSLPRKAAPVFTKAGEGKAVKMSIMLEKGVEVQSRYVIKQEKVFEDTQLEDDSDDDEDDDNERAYQEYFVFSRSSKFFAIALLDCYDKPVKLSKGAGVTVVFEIKRDGVSQGLAYTPLDEPWSDGMYYFSTLNFRKSGKYTISFLVEGAKMSHIKPLVFPIVVEAEHISHGPSCALGRLRAADYITHADRHIIHRRRELLTEIGRSESEFVAVKALLLAVYLALPMGAIVMGPEDEDKRNDIFGHIAEATGWNSNLDQTWRGCVLEASSPAVLMECVLVLEYYISGAWLMSPENKLLGALPSHHFAVRCVTNSSVALRIFCLDKCLEYDRIQNVPRGTRVKGDSNRATSVSGGGSTVAIAPPRKSRNNLSAKRSLELSRSGYQEDDTPPTMYGDRPRRGASLRAREALTATAKQFQDDSDEERVGRRRNLRERAPPMPEWACHMCTALNDHQLKNCQVCLTKRLNPRDASNSTSRLSRAERLQLRQKAYMSNSEDDDGDESKDSSKYDDDSDDDSAPVAARKSSSSGRNKRSHSRGSAPTSANDREAELGLRKRTRVSYAESKSDDDHDDDDDDNQQDGLSDADGEDEHAIDLDFMIRARQGTIDEDQWSKDITLNLLTILKKLGDDPDSSFFWSPVPLDVYIDYSDKISEPMDFGTIAKRAEVSFYGEDHEDFARHVRLVVSNCKEYNMEGSEICLCAERIGEYFEHLYFQFLQTLQADPDSIVGAGLRKIDTEMRPPVDVESNSISYSASVQTVEGVASPPISTPSVPVAVVVETERTKCAENDVAASDMMEVVEPAEIDIKVDQALVVPPVFADDISHESEDAKDSV